MSQDEPQAIPFSVSAIRETIPRSRQMDNTIIDIQRLQSPVTQDAYPIPIQRHRVAPVIVCGHLTIDAAS